MENNSSNVWFQGYKSVVTTVICCCHGYMLLQWLPDVAKVTCCCYDYRRVISQPEDTTVT